MRITGGPFVCLLLISLPLHAEEKAPPLAVAPFDAKAAEQHQQAWARHLKVDAEIKNSIGMKMRLIPAGEFTMGSPEPEEQRFKNETQHKVRITKAFYLGKYEVTQAEFRKVMGRNSSYFSDTEGEKKKLANLVSDRYPVENVSWYDAAEFCNKLSESESLPAYYRLTNIERNDDESIKKADVTVLGGRGYRLPTEAEWEYACRAGTTTPFHFGAANNGQASNIEGRAPFGTTTRGPALERTISVGRYDANKFGLHDMHGNVWEWCHDWYDEKYYAKSPAADPTGAESGTSRVTRGGSWFGDGGNSRSGHRSGLSPDFRFYFLGFRVAGGVPTSTR